MRNILFFFLFFIFGSCNEVTDKNKPQQNNSLNWHHLTLQFNDTIIRVYITADTLERVIPAGMTEKFPITGTQKSLLFTCAYDLINFKTSPKRFCTCYAGNLMVRIRYNAQVRKEVHFSSICEWREMDSNTYKMDQLLRQIITSKRH